jgi:hypothetical protein
MSRFAVFIASKQHRPQLRPVRSDSPVRAAVLISWFTTAPFKAADCGDA